MCSNELPLATESLVESADDKCVRRHETDVSVLSLQWTGNSLEMVLLKEDKTKMTRMNARAALNSSRPPTASQLLEQKFQSPTFLSKGGGGTTA